MTAAVAEFRCDGDPLDDIWLAGAMGDARDRQAATVVLFDATAESLVRPAFSAAALRSLVLFELPVVFAFEGALSGAITELALACDIRLCGRGASLRGRLRANARIRTLTDEGTALLLYLGQAAIDAPGLLARGLVSVVSEPGEALAEARRTAAAIASRGPIATRFGKEAIWRGLAQPLEQALRFETDLTLLLQTTKDRDEGVRAFLEKRAPVFKGE